MTDEQMTNEERAIDDKLDFFFSENIEVHLKLHRTLEDGRSVFLNGFLKCRNTPRVWNLQERKLGSIRIALSEIKSVEEAR